MTLNADRDLSASNNGTVPQTSRSVEKSERVSERVLGHLEKQQVKVFISFSLKENMASFELDKLFL